MASRFATVSKGEILVVTDVAAPKNTNEKDKILLVARKKFLPECATRKNDSRYT